MSIVGWIATILLCAALALAALAYLVDRILALVNWIKMRGNVEARTDVGRELLSSAWWFGESTETTDAIRKIGEAYLERQCFDVGQLREAWRKKRDAPSA